MKCLVPGFLALFLLGGQDQPQPDPKEPKKPPSQREEGDPSVFQPLSEEQEKKLQEDRKRYTIEAVKTEPVLPPVEEAAKHKHSVMPGGGYYTKGQSGNAERVVLPGRIGIDQGLIEVFATLGPKDHESVMRVSCDIQILDLVLSSWIKLKRGTHPEKYGESDASDGSRILMFITWTQADGTQVTHRAEDLLIDVKRNRLFPRVGWLYQGGWEETENPATRQRRKILRAALSKLMVTTWRDPYSLIDNVLKDEDATDDIYAANMFLLPPPGTKILVSLRRPTDKEMEEIKRVEREFYQQ